MDGLARRVAFGRSTDQRLILDFFNGPRLGLLLKKSLFANPQQLLQLPEVALEAHALGDIQLPVANGNPACYISVSLLPPMEIVLSILGSILALLIFLTIFAIPIGVFAAGIAAGSDKWESEDQAQYRAF